MRYIESVRFEGIRKMSDETDSVMCSRMQKSDPYELLKPISHSPA